MQRNRRISVVILYRRPLLGEGIARFLAAEPGLTVTHVQIHDIDAAEAALAARPDVIILERSDAQQAMGVLELLPDALIIDVGFDAGPTFTYHREEIPARPEGILRAIRRMRRTGRSAATGAAVLTVVTLASIGLFGGA